jgi:hypothetical protein
MPPKKPKFDKSLGVYTLNGQKLIKYGDRFITEDQLLALQDQLAIRNGEIQIIGDQTPETIEKMLDEDINSFNTLSEKHMEEHGRPMDQKDWYFLYDFETFRNKLKEAGESSKLINTMSVKYMIINPTQRPESDKKIPKKEKGKKVISPLTGIKISVNSSHFKELLNIYAYDEKNDKLIIKDITKAFNYKSGQLVDKSKITFQKAINNQVVIGNVIMDTKVDPMSRKFALQGKAEEYRVDFALPMSINEYDTLSLTNVVRKNINFAREAPFRVRLTMHLVGYNPKAPPPYDYFTYDESLGIITFSGDNLQQFLNQVKLAINKLIEEYQDTNTGLRKISAITFQILPTSKITVGSNVKIVKGGCNLHTWFPSIKFDTNNFLKWNQDRFLLYVKSNDNDNNCLFHLIYAFIRMLNKKKGVSDKALKAHEKTLLFNDYRKELGIEVGETVSIECLPLIAKSLEIKLKYIDAESGLVLDEFSNYVSSSDEDCLKLTVMANHYFGVVEEDDPKYSVACKRHLELDLDFTELIGLNDIEDQAKEEKAEKEKKKAEKLVKDKEKEARKLLRLEKKKNKDPFDKYLLKYRLPLRGESDEPEIDYDSVLHLKGLVDPSSPEKCVSYLGLYGIVFVKFKFWEEIINFCQENEVVLVNCFEGAKIEYFHLKKYLDTLSVRIHDKKQLTFFQGRILHINFHQTQCIDLSLFFRNQKLSKLCSEMGIWSKNKMTNYQWLNSLKKLFFRYNSLIYDRYGFNFCQFNTISAMSEHIWIKSVSDKYKIYYPSVKQYHAIMEAKYGARTYPLVHHFVSKSWSENGDSKAEFLASEDYLRIIDVNSCYADTMYRYRFPVGRAIDVKGRFKMEKELGMGFYKISFRAPRNIRVPLLVKHGDGLLHNLENGDGCWYIHEEINFAFQQDYEIWVNEGFYWENSEYLFRDFVKENYPNKVKADCPVLRQASKDILNSCFGKLIQKIGKYNHENCSEVGEFDQFYDSYYINSLKFLDNGEIFVSGKSNKVLSYEIYKPYHLGVFILGYTRVSMLRMMKVISPRFLQVPFYYHSTDSFVVSQKNYVKLREAGYLGEKNVDNMFESMLGKLFDEKDGHGGTIGYIVEAEFFAPNKYRFKYLDRESFEVKEKITFSGIPKKLVNYVDFDQLEKQYSYHRIERRKKGNEEIGLTYVLRTQTHQNKLWNKMHFDSRLGQWFPFGYQAK